MSKDLWPDFVTFAKAQLSSGDIDPVYPVLKHNFQVENVGFDVQYWRLALYLTFYNLGSAEYWWNKEIDGYRDAPKRVQHMPTGVERRGMRGNTPLVQNFLQDMMNPRMIATVETARMKGGTSGWIHAQVSIIQHCRGAGSWASYKWADLLKHVMGLPITAHDLGIGGGGREAGPIPGLSKLTGLPWEECAADQMLQENVYQRALDSGVPFNGLDQLETACCDFSSLLKGHYYVGHDIDQMMNQLSAASALWDSRKATLPHNYLGEISGWTGVDAERKKVYRDTGVIVTR